MNLICVLSSGSDEVRTHNLLALTTLAITTWSQYTRHVNSMLVWCWTTIYAVGLALSNHWLNVSYLLGRLCAPSAEYTNIKPDDITKWMRNQSESLIIAWGLVSLISPSFVYQPIEPWYYQMLPCFYLSLRAVQSEVKQQGMKYRLLASRPGKTGKISCPCCCNFGQPSLTPAQH